MAAASSGTGQEARDRRYWFHILARPAPEARLRHAVKLTEKAWRQGDRVCLLCDTEDQARELDDLLWNFKPDAFIPHSIATTADTPCDEPVGILLYPPAASDWDTVIVLSSTLPDDAAQYRRLALIAHNDPAVLSQARQHYRQLRAMGIEARVHDMRKKKG